VKTRLLNVLNPYSGTLVGSVMAASAAEVQVTVEAAQCAWREFRWSAPGERQALLEALADQVTHRGEPLSQLISAETGKTWIEARREVQAAQQLLRLYGEAALTHQRELRPGLRYAPVGVVAVVTPFYAPLEVLCRQLGAAIAAGNAVVVKPSSKAPLAAAWLGQLAASADWPGGLFSVLQGAADTAATLVIHNINILSFTGRISTGLALKNASGLVRCLMLLGGQTSQIVMPDANLNDATTQALADSFGSAGQRAPTLKNLYVHQNIYDDLLACLSARATQLRLGDPTQASTTIGPVIDAAAAVAFESRINRALAEGARCLVGGKRHGTLCQPTLLAAGPQALRPDPNGNAGPLLVIHGFDDPTSLIETLNVTPCAGTHQTRLFTQDAALVQRFARELQVEHLLVNQAKAQENLPAALQAMSQLREVSY
jgi:acyl-CoA reductase-like NAD-dependent aldehyde dehydrogenase